MISCALSPNTEPDDVWLALKLLFMPWVWKRGPSSAKVEKRLGGLAFNSGRGALLGILRSFGIGKGDEVICQVFTCVAVPNSIRWAGGTPVFADIDKSYNMDIHDLEKKINRRTRAVIVQHTFGTPADMDSILTIANKYRIKVIEDFAHTMTLPLRGHAGFYSFGRDKVLSSVFGGLALGVDLKHYQKSLEYPSYFWIFQQLMHPVAFALILPTYRIFLGKIILVTLQKLHLLSFPNDIDPIPKRYPNALATLLLNQLKKLDRYSRQREQVVRFYGGKVALLRYPMRVDNPASVIQRAKKYGILLGNWYHNVIDPIPVGYTAGSCPHAEEAAKHIINLPTRIRLQDAARVKAIL